MQEIRHTIMSEGSPLKDLVIRALQTSGDWNVGALRAPGFEMIETILADPQFRAAVGPLGLPINSQSLFDAAVIEVGTQRLTFVNDLISEGLTTPLADPLGVTSIEWGMQGRVGAAKRTMTPSARGENKLPYSMSARLPVYLTSDNFELDIRTLRMSQRLGQPLDTNLIAQCTRSVNEAIEDAAINGATTIDGQQLKVAGYAAPGLLNAPNANVVPTTLDWTAANVVGTTGDAIISDVSKAITALHADKHYGPYNVYTSTKAGIALEGDYKTNGSITTRQRLESMTFGGRPLRIRYADMFPAASTGPQAAVVQMTRDVVDIIDGQRPTAIPWTSADGFTFFNLIMAIMIARFRTDVEGNSGVAIITKP